MSLGLHQDSGGHEFRVSVHAGDMRSSSASQGGDLNAWSSDDVDISEDFPELERKSSHGVPVILDKDGVPRAPRRLPADQVVIPSDRKELQHMAMQFVGSSSSSNTAYVRKEDPGSAAAPEAGAAVSKNNVSNSFVHSGQGIVASVPRRKGGINDRSEVDFMYSALPSSYAFETKQLPALMRKLDRELEGKGNQVNLQNVSPRRRTHRAAGESKTVDRLVSLYGALADTNAGRRLAAARSNDLATMMSPAEKGKFNKSLADIKRRVVNDASRVEEEEVGGGEERRQRYDDMLQQVLRRREAQRKLRQMQSQNAANDPSRKLNAGSQSNTTSKLDSAEFEIKDGKVVRRVGSEPKVKRVPMLPIKRVEGSIYRTASSIDVEDIPHTPPGGTSSQHAEWTDESHSHGGSHTDRPGWYQRGRGKRNTGFISARPDRLRPLAREVDTPTSGIKRRQAKPSDVSPSRRRTDAAGRQFGIVSEPRAPVNGQGSSVKDMRREQKQRLQNWDAERKRPEFPTQTRKLASNDKKSRVRVPGHTGDIVRPIEESSLLDTASKKPPVIFGPGMWDEDVARIKQELGAQHSSVAATRGPSKPVQSNGGQRQQRDSKRSNNRPRRDQVRDNAEQNSEPPNGKKSKKGVKKNIKAKMNDRDIRIQGPWLVMIEVIRRTAKWHAFLVRHRSQSEPERLKRHFAARRLQIHWNKHYHKVRVMKNIINRFRAEFAIYKYAQRWKNLRKIRSANLITKVLQDMAHQNQFWIYMMRFRYRVVQCQRAVRAFIAISRARRKLIVLSWNRFDKNRLHQAMMQREHAIGERKQELQKSLKTKAPSHFGRYVFRLPDNDPLVKQAKKLAAERINHSRREFISESLPSQIKDLPIVPAQWKALFSREVLREKRKAYMDDLKEYKRRLHIWNEEKIMRDMIFGLAASQAQPAVPEQPQNSSHKSTNDASPGKSKRLNAIADGALKQRSAPVRPLMNLRIRRDEWHRRVDKYMEDIREHGVALSTRLLVAVPHTLQYLHSRKVSMSEFHDGDSDAGSNPRSRTKSISSVSSLPGLSGPPSQASSLAASRLPSSKGVDGSDQHLNDGASETSVDISEYMQRMVVWDEEGGIGATNPSSVTPPVPPPPPPKLGRKNSGRKGSIFHGSNIRQQTHARR